MYLSLFFILFFVISSTFAGLFDLAGDILNPITGGLNIEPKEEIKQKVTTPKPPPHRQECIPSKTKITTSTFKYCKGDLIFSDDFEQPFNIQQAWTVEQYMPIEEGPDFEFVSYENNDDIVYKRNGKLIFNPTPRLNESEVYGELDLTNGCTSQLQSQCYLKRNSVQLIPPVRSAKISNKFGFTYGKIEVKAKLPQGHWIYPEIQLESTSKYAPLKIIIAYARGNNHFFNNQDEGSRLLFGGIVFNNKQAPERLKFTRTRPNLHPYGNETHTYTLIWEPDLITLLFNNEEYGRILIDNEEDERFFPLRRTFHLSLGVGVGGINDFPDGYLTNPKKPWVNAERHQVKHFFDNRNEWFGTWTGGKSVMEVNSVKIYAV